MACPIRISFFKRIADLPLYIRSFFSKTAIYSASYIEQDIKMIGSKTVVSIYLHPVFFDEGDEILAPNMIGAQVIPESNLIQTKILGDLIYDKDTNILFYLYAKLIGKNQRTSLLDIRNNRSSKARKVFAFLAHLIRYDGDTVKLGSIRNKPPVNYKNLISRQ